MGIIKIPSVVLRVLATLCDKAHNQVTTNTLCYNTAI